MGAASDSDAPTLSIRPHESLPSNVFHDSTPIPGISNTAPPISAGIAGDRRCTESVSQSASVAANTASVLISVAENGWRFSSVPGATGTPGSNGPTRRRSSSAPPNSSAQYGTASSVTQPSQEKPPSSEAAVIDASPPVSSAEDASGLSTPSASIS